MAQEKNLLSLDESLLASARDRVGAQGLTQYVNEALRLQLQRDRIADLLNQMEQEHGPSASEVMDEVREEWPDATTVRRRSA